MLESNFESVRGDIHNHWVSLIKEGLLAGAIIFCSLVSFDFGLKLFEDRLAAVGLALLVFISLVFFALKLTKWESRRATQANEDQFFEEIEPLKPLWGNGEEIFAKEWVLSLSTKVLKVSFVSEASVEEFYRKLGYYYSAAKAAVSYFHDGKYRIGRDGSMSKIYNEEAGLAELLQINATIDFMDLPYFETVERRLAMKPTTFMEKAKNCVLLDVHAHGVENGTEEHYIPRFAVRDGKVIVESF